MTLDGQQVCELCHLKKIFHYLLLNWSTRTAYILGYPLNFYPPLYLNGGFPGCSVGKRICLQCWRPGFDPWVGKIPWRGKWQPTPVFLPGESLGQRCLVGCSSRGHTESDTTERLTLFNLDGTAFRSCFLLGGVGSYFQNCEVECFHSFSTQDK